MLLLGLRGALLLEDSAKRWYELTDLLKAHSVAELRRVCNRVRAVTERPDWAGLLKFYTRYVYKRWNKYIKILISSELKIL